MMVHMQQTTSLTDGGDVCDSSRRKRTSRVDYRKLAGEDCMPSVTEISTCAPLHVNKHIPHVLSRSFSPLSSTLITISDGRTLTSSYIRSNGLSKPILVEDTPESIGMSTPGVYMDIWHLANLIGYAHPVSLIDVSSQEDISGWTMSNLVNYFEQRKAMRSDSEPWRKKIIPEEGYSNRVLNQISLEFSKTPLIKKVISPQFVRDIDWIDNVWPKSRRNKNDYPRVQYYCLTSTAGCYTDFHVDMGGTSVWYHIHSGQKIFLLIPPTKENLEKYEAWLCSPTQEEEFFADQVLECYKITLNAKQTFVIPSGWIHAVYTPMDSIAFGGNFLHSYDIPTQIDVHCIETRSRVNQKFRFPHFVEMMFYAGAHLYRNWSDLSRREMDALPLLIDALKGWECMPNAADAAKEAAAMAGFETARDMIEEMHRWISEKSLEERARVISPIASDDSCTAIRPHSNPKCKLKLSLKDKETKCKLKLSLKDINSNQHQRAPVQNEEKEEEVSFQIFIPQNPIYAVKTKKPKHESDCWKPKKRNRPSHGHIVKPQPKLHRIVSNSPESKHTIPTTRPDANVILKKQKLGMKHIQKSNKNISVRDRLKKRLKF